MPRSEKRTPFQTPFDTDHKKVVLIPTDQQVAREFVDQYTVVVTRIVTNQLQRVQASSWEIAAVTSDIFAKIVERIHRYNHEKGVFSSWVISVAQRHALNEARDRGRRGAKELLYTDVFPEQSADFFASSDDTPEEILIRQEELNWLYQAIQELIPSWQQALYYQYVEELSQAEIAEILGSTTGGVKSLKKRAIDRLREMSQQLQIASQVAPAVR